MNVLIFPLATLLLGLLLGLLAFWIFHRTKHGSFEKISTEIINKAEQEAEKIRKRTENELKEHHTRLQKQIEEEWQIERKKMEREENRLKQREDKLDLRLNLIEKKLLQIDKEEKSLHKSKEKLDEEKERIQKAEEMLYQELEKVSGLTTTEAREVLLTQLTEEVKTDAANFIRRQTKEAEEEAERIASKILATAINRLARPCVSELTVNTVSLPHEDLKGRIIGREGRNIRTLERATGVNFLIDDTPGAVVLSGFDPIRLHIAKTALTELIMDGRIHPTSIEEAVENAREITQKKIREYGEDAALRAGQTNLHPELISLLGKLKFRYSFGQNILDHSLEVSYLMGMIAAELHLDERLAKRIGLLHDIGKAVSHEVEGTHALIGHDIALKSGESIEVANGIGCHHNEMEPITIEASFCGAADAISASRPGARIEAVEEYLKRVRRLEDIAYEFPGIDKAYAMQAGRELCIVVLPDMIDDEGTNNLARDLTKKIEREIHYPGKIKVTVIREKRAVEYAV